MKLILKCSSFTSLTFLTKLLVGFYDKLKKLRPFVLAIGRLFKWTSLDAALILTN